MNAAPDRSLRCGAPERFQLLVEFLRDAEGAPSGAILGDPNPCRVPDDYPVVEVREFTRNAPDEVPRAVASGEKIRHDGGTLLDVLLDVFPARGRIGPNETATA